MIRCSARPAYQELYRVYGQDGIILGQMYQTLVRDWHNENLDLRHFTSPMAVRNLANDIPDDVVDTVIECLPGQYFSFSTLFPPQSTLVGNGTLDVAMIFMPGG